MSVISSSSLPLCFKPPRFHGPAKPLDLLFPFLISKSSRSRPLVCFSVSPSNSSSFDREEARWLREEQRWLREEQRWMREEQRWQAERDSLLREITALKLRIQELELRQGEIHGVSLANIAAALLQKGEALNQIAERGSGAVPMELEEVKQVVGEAVESRKTEDEVKQVVREEEKRWATLRKGSEGEDVRAMQEALLNLGFYSGEEDMEFSSFSSGTERAVKTWQATIGSTEDGIMTAELQERLYMEQKIKGSGPFGLEENADPKGSDVTAINKEGGNGAAVASVTEISEIQHTVVEGVTDVEVSHQRVFLLGENRWEDPSRLASGNKQVGGVKSKGSTTECLSCRGEGRLLCTGIVNVKDKQLA
ncbi:protein disulfide isomerase pTAC5, chloroplastic isoform X2 [Diospyros lotus]|uniref:protein disulfide isomerase pTAC5, chloroplastic isoform X2 n=1 Tax=Diospyros lotus TaxID=55363 RepID=UPI00225470A4|nr:protein disulfide isomerase pTAC5, chloroplastic isoform X2 [Diospyros lotus]